MKAYSWTILVNFKQTTYIESYQVMAKDRGHLLKKKIPIGNNSYHK